MLGDILKGQSGPVLITGNTGFKGSWLTLLLEALGVPQVGYSLAPEPGSLFESLALNHQIPYRIADIRDKQSLFEEFRNKQPSTVIHMAAQSLVLKSYENPIETFETNVMGTINVLEAARSTPSVKTVLVITTDKVYRNYELGRKFVESDALMGKDPYSASKVSTESVCVAWQHMNALNGVARILVARAGNVIGGGDTSAFRLIPDIVKSIQSRMPLQVRNMNATRPWQHVLDPLVGYIQYIEAELKGGNPPPALNFGPLEESKRVNEVISIAKKYFGDELEIHDKSLESIEKEAITLDLDSSLAQSVLRWAPVWDQKAALDQTFIWWKKHLKENTDVYTCCSNDINKYIEKLKERDYQSNSALE